MQITRSNSLIQPARERSRTPRAVPEAEAIDVDEATIEDPIEAPIERSCTETLSLRQIANIVGQRRGWNDQWPDFVCSLDSHGVLDRDIGKVLPLLERLELEGRLGSAALTQCARVRRI